MNAKISSILLGLFLGSCCATTDTKTVTVPDESEEGFGTLPGGDCVISLNPSPYTGYGASFIMPYDLDGSAGFTTHTVNIGSARSNIEVGSTGTGTTRATLLKGHLYEMTITELEGPYVELKDLTVPTNPVQQASVTNVGASDLTVSGFTVIPRGTPAPGVSYHTIYIAAVDSSTSSTKGIKFQVNMP